MKALIVDDELTTRIVLHDVLSRYGEVTSCTDGTEAVDACNRALDAGRPYDLICLDLTMPTMSGLEALRLIRQSEERHGCDRHNGAKVIITTATDDTGTISKAFEGLCDAYVVKPIDPADLLNIIYCLCPLA